MSRWPHAPSHEVTNPWAYIVTASTYKKARLFDTPEKLLLLEDLLLGSLEELGWSVQAWAVFANHYHLVAFSPEGEANLTELMKQVHRCSARDLNTLDGATGRQVWYRYWDTRITFERSYLARLAYVHNNPVKHGLVSDPSRYRWCSARWFQERAKPPFYKTVMSFKTDAINVYDDF